MIFSILEMFRNEPFLLLMITIGVACAIGGFPPMIERKRRRSIERSRGLRNRKRPLRRQDRRESGRQKKGREDSRESGKQRREGTREDRREKGRENT